LIRLNNPFFRAMCLVPALTVLLCGCGLFRSTPPPPSPPPEVSEEPLPSEEPPEPYAVLDPEGMTLEERFNPPEGFVRVEAEEGSFGAYLRAFPLKPDGDPVYLHDGTIRPDAAFDAVLDMRINNNRNRMRNVHFLMRLRAEYLYHAGRGDEISFHFLSGFVFDFATWSGGSRIREDSNGRVTWQAEAFAADDSYNVFWEYLQHLYNYSNATALRQDLLQAARAEAGYVFLNHGGAVIADMAADENNRTAVLLVRGGDPEQEGYVVQNANDPGNSPWFIVPDNGILRTPEGDFSVGDLFMFRG
jgi:hypothetical protein